MSSSNNPDTNIDKSELEFYEQWCKQNAKAELEKDKSDEDSDDEELESDADHVYHKMMNEVGRFGIRDR